MNRILKTTAAIIICLLLSQGAKSSHLISYQGILNNSVGIPVVDSIYNVQFAIFNDSTAGIQLWNESALVQTGNGLFFHLLGSVTNLDDSVFQNHANVFLEISVGGEPILPRSRIASVGRSVTSANLNMTDNSGNLAAKTNSDRHSLSFYDTSETEVIILSGTDTGNAAVVLPESAIDYTEILDEPGVTASFNINQVALFTGEMADLVTVEITTPADGYILLHGKCYVLLSGTTGPNNAFVQIDDEENGPAEFPYYTIAGLGGYANTGISYFPVYVTRIFFRTAGTHTFRMEGRASFPPPAEATSWDHYLTAVYYPSAYSAVKSLTNDPTKFVNPKQIDVSNRRVIEENGTYYEVDLRESEKKEKKDQK